MRKFDCHKTELMDRPQQASEELKATLLELESLNRRFGGHRYAVRFIKKRFTRSRNYRVLDLGTGGGDFPRAMINWGRSHGVGLVVDAVDASESVIEIAEKLSADFPEIHFAVDRAETYEADHYYDLVHCSLSMHHFSASDAVAVLGRCRDLSREFVLVTDLERSVWTRIGVHLANVVFSRQDMTRKDGDTSARRAFSFREFSALAKGAGWPNFGHERFLFCRQALWVPGD